MRKLLLPTMVCFALISIPLDRAEAAAARNGKVLISGVASKEGTVKIVGDNPAFSVSVGIMTGWSPSQSARAIRTALRASPAVQGAYNVSSSGGSVSITNTLGSTFTLSIKDCPAPKGQTIDPVQPIPAECPSSTPIGLLVTAGLLSLAGMAIAMRHRLR